MAKTRKAGAQPKLTFREEKEVCQGDQWLAFLRNRFVLFSRQIIFADKACWHINLYRKFSLAGQTLTESGPRDYRKLCI